MRINKIVELELETRCKQLKDEGNTERDIADKLTIESHQPISQAGVHRYLTSLVKDKQAVIDRSDKLKVKIIEAELDTVQARHEIIDELRKLATQAKDANDISLAIAGLHRAILALDSLDKRLGRFMSGGGVQVNVNQTVQFNEQYNELKAIVVNTLCDNCKEKVRLKLHEVVSE
jgi:hypothetical protein